LCFSDPPDFAETIRSGLQYKKLDIDIEPVHISIDDILLAHAPCPDELAVTTALAGGAYISAIVPTLSRVRKTSSGSALGTYSLGHADGQAHTLSNHRTVIAFVIVLDGLGLGGLGSRGAAGHQAKDRDKETKCLRHHPTRAWRNRQSNSIRWKA
jgi:hypothetical protein